MIFGPLLSYGVMPRGKPVAVGVGSVAGGTTVADCTKIVPPSPRLGSIKTAAPSWSKKRIFALLKANAARNADAAFVKFGRPAPPWRGSGAAPGGRRTFLFIRLPRRRERAGAPR